MKRLKGSDTMKIIINGEEKQLPTAVNIKYLISLYHFDPEKVVIEHNQKILNKDEWGHTVLNENDKIEAITFVGGG